MKFRVLIIFAFVLKLSVTVLSRKSGLDNFISRRKIDNYKITILNDLNEVNRTWIEYHYNFKEEGNGNIDTNIADDTNTTFALSYENEQENETINVYFIPSEHQFDFDCRCEHGSSYTPKLLAILSDYDALTYSYFNSSDTDDWKTVDLIVCHGYGHNYIEKGFIPLFQTLKSRYALIYKANKQQKPKDIFVLTFVGTLWLCFLVVLLSLAVCLRISTYHYSYMYEGNRRWSWVEITLWAIAAACQQGFSYTPSRATSRIFFFLGYLTAYVLYTAFTAAITSVLVQQEKVAINVDDYKVIGYAIIHNTIGSIKIASHANDLHYLFEKIEEKSNIGLGPQVLLEQYITFNGLDANGYNLITLYGNTEYQSGFWLNKSLLEIRKTINYRLINVSETGILKAALSKSLKTLLPVEINEGYSSASLEHVKSAILLFSAGVAVSLVFLIMELGVYGYRHR